MEPLTPESSTSAQKPPSTDPLILALTDGDDDVRGALIDDLADGTIQATPGQRDALLDALDRFAPDISPRRDAAEVRSWVISALLWIDVEDHRVRDRALRHVQERYEPDRDTRYRALRGLWLCGASYVRQAADLAIRGKPDPQFRDLADSIQSTPQELTAKVAGLLQSEKFTFKLNALRTMQAAPQPELLPQVVELLDARVEGRRLDALALRVLAHPRLDGAGTAILLEAGGLVGLLRWLAAFQREHPGDRAISALLAPIPLAQLRPALGALASDEPELAQALTELSRLALALSPDGDRAGQYIAGFQSDDLDVDNDYLGVSEDVETLTAVMLAKSVEPPLAIGLFGDWGSGKSFFMKAMRKATARIVREKNPRYCAEVVEIEFNAWHYVDTNLLAGLVSHLLEKLSAYVSPTAPAEQREAELLNSLASAKQAVEGVSAEKVAAETQRKARADDLHSLQAERARKELQLRDLRVDDLQAVLNANPEAKSQLETALKDLGAPAAVGAMTDLRDAVHQAHTLQGRLMAFAVGLVKGPNRFVMIPLLLFVLAGPFVVPALLGLFPTLRPQWTSVTTWLAEAAALVGGAAHVLKTAGGWVSKRLDDLEKARDGVQAALAKKRSEAGPKEVGLQQEIAKLKAEEDHVAERLRAANDKVAELEKKIADIRDGRSLVRFLSERSGSDDYRRYEGLVAVVRRDFEALAARLADPAAAKGGRPVERIVLYIDDLDRCPEEKVVEVLEAVHLLLAFPLFVVVVGVDPRWLAHALTANYGAFDKSGRKPEWRTTPQDYLEKIFQIPINLRPMSPGGFAKLVGGLMGHAGGSASPAASAGAMAAQAEAGVRGPVEIPAEAQPQGRVPQGRLPPSPVEPPPRKGRGAAARAKAAHVEAEAAAPAHSDPVRAPPPTPTSPIRVAEEALSITPQETAFAARLHRLFPTPRATKRFANTWRLLKAGVKLRDLGDFEGSEAAPGTFRAPMLLLAMVVGSPRIAEVVLPRLFETATQGGDVLAELQRELADEAAPKLPRDILAILKDPGFPATPDMFLEWLPKVSRYSFDLGRSFSGADAPAPRPRAPRRRAAA